MRIRINKQLQSDRTTRSTLFVAVTLLSTCALVITPGCCKDTGIIEAAGAGNAYCVREIIEKRPDAMFDVDPNGDGDLTAAAMAVLSGHNDIAKYLIEKGYPLGVTDRTPCPIIMDCLSSYSQSSDEMLIYVLKKGANPNERYMPKGWLPLTMAVSNEMETKVRILAQFGADMNGRDEYGHTAMEIAVTRLSQFKDPKFNLPEHVLNDPKVRREMIEKWERMVELLKSLGGKWTAPTNRAR